MDMNDPNVRRTIARMRLMYREMRREGKLLVQGYPVTPSAATSVQRTWQRYDWCPPSQLRETA